MHSFLIKFTLVSNSALLFWKLLVSEFLPDISETLHCSVSAPHVTIFFLIIYCNCCYYYYYLDLS
jgi:hypothetical protein